MSNQYETFISELFNEELQLHNYIIWKIVCASKMGIKIAKKVCK